MAVTLTPGEQQRHAGTFQFVDAVTMTTATGLQTIDITADCITITGCTATGFGVSRLLLPTADAVEGQQMAVAMLSTGEVYLVFRGATATGALVFSSTNNWAYLKYLNGSWGLLANRATIATATGAA